MTSVSTESSSDFSGSCRCGQLSYHVTQPIVLAAYCHCHACQKRTSAPCTGFIMVKESATEFKGNMQGYTETGGSGAPMDHNRCTDCGTAVFTRLNVLEDIIGIPASTLNKPEDFQPEVHVWTSSKDARFEIKDELPQLPGPPLSVAKFIRR